MCSVVRVLRHLLRRGSACRAVSSSLHHQVMSLSALLRGPDTLVVSAGERFQPMSAFSDPGMMRPPGTLTHKRRAYTGSNSVAQKLREKRERLTKTRTSAAVFQLGIFLRALHPARTGLRPARFTSALPEKKKKN